VHEQVDLATAGPSIGGHQPGTAPLQEGEGDRLTDTP